jgi:hypothetical protein
MNPRQIVAAWEKVPLPAKPVERGSGRGRDCGGGAEACGAAVETDEVECELPQPLSAASANNPVIASSGRAMRSA